MFQEKKLDFPDFPDVLHPSKTFMKNIFPGYTVYTLTVLFVEGALSSNCARSNIVFIFARCGHLSPLPGRSLIKKTNAS